MISLKSKKPVLPIKDVEDALMVGDRAYHHDRLVYMRMLRVHMLFNYREPIETGAMYLDPAAMVEVNIPEFDATRWENMSEHAEFLRYKGNGFVQREHAVFMLSDKYDTKTRKVWGGKYTEVIPSKPLIMIDYTPDRKEGTARIDRLRINGKKIKLTEANTRKALSLAYYCLQEMTLNNRLPFQKGMTMIFGKKRQKQMAVAAPHR